jgi:TPR repeat protein
MAINYYQASSSQGHPGGQFCLAMCYRKGTGISQDLDKAFQYFLQSGKQGHSWAQTEVGYCYLTAQGVEENLTEAIKWLKKAALRKEPYAQYYLGYCYRHGLGVAIDPGLSKKYFELSEIKDNVLEQEDQDTISSHSKLFIRR